MEDPHYWIIYFPAYIFYKMRTVFHLVNSFIAFGLLVIFLTACGEPTLQPLLPDQIVSASAKRMREATGFHFLIECTGPFAYIDANETVAFRRADGSFVPPDQAEADVRVIAPGIVADVSMVSIGDRYWETNVLTREWEEYPQELAFNPAVLFDPETGLQPILEADLSDLVYEGTAQLEEMPGVQLHLVSGILNTERVYTMSYGLIGPEPMATRMWVMPNSFDLVRIEMVKVVPGEEEDQIWHIDFWNYDKPADIQPPITAS